MLVIRRRAGDSILIGDQVEIQVMECGPHRVKLGIRAPQEVQVVRAEVKRTRDQNLAAARAVPVDWPRLIGSLRGTTWHPTQVLGEASDKR
jgi:carbon storage regulator